MVVVVSLHLMPVATDKGTSGVQTTPELGFRSSHDYGFLFFGSEYSHFSGSSFGSKLVLFFFLFNGILLVHLLLCHKLY